MACGPGAGSGEFDISWDAPGPDDEEITRFRIYVNEDGAGFATLNNLVVADGVIDMTRNGGTRWAGTAYPVTAFVPLEIAVTAFDEAGNESGWNPIDAYYGGGALPCSTGAPPAPSLASIHRGAGSGEIDIEVTPPAADVVDYSVSADINGAGYVALTVLLITDSSLTPGDSRITAVGTEWSVPVDYQVIAIDAHGNSSPVSTKSCAAIPGPADLC